MRRNGMVCPDRQTVMVGQHVLIARDIVRFVAFIVGFALMSQIGKLAQHLTGDVFPYVSSTVPEVSRRQAELGRGAAQVLERAARANLQASVEGADFRHALVQRYR